MDWELNDSVLWIEAETSRTEVVERSGKLRERTEVNETVRRMQKKKGDSLCHCKLNIRVGTRGECDATEE